jgi:transcriptional regulator with XRE-family HTH domain
LRINGLNEAGNKKFGSLHFIPYGWRQGYQRYYMANSFNRQKTGFAAGAKGERALPQPNATGLPISRHNPPNVELAILGKAIRRVRESRRMSQMAMGEESGLHRTYICDIERGARNVTFLSLLKLAHALGTTVSELTREAGSSMRPPLEAQNGWDPTLQAAISPTANSGAQRPPGRRDFRPLES